MRSNNQRTVYAHENGYDNYYDLLGVDEDASPETIEVALSDTRSGMFTQPTDTETQLGEEAMGILLHPDSRSEYDKLGHEAYAAKYKDCTSFSVETDNTSSESQPPKESATEPVSEMAEPSTTDTTAPPPETAPNDSPQGGIKRRVDSLFPDSTDGTAIARKAGIAITAALLATVSWLWALIRGKSDPETGISGWYYPSNELVDGEEVVEEVVPSRWTSLGPYTLGMLFYIFAIGGSWAITTGYVFDYINSRLGFLTVEAFHIPYWWAFPLFCVLMGTTVIFAEFLLRASTWYVLTDTRVIVRENPLSKQADSFKVNQLSRTTEKSPFPINMLNIGHVDIYTSASGDKERRLWYLPESSKFKKELDVAENEDVKKSRQQATVDNTENSLDG